VLSRVEELANRPEGFTPEGAIGYKSLVPLDEIIAEAKNISKASKAVEKEYLDIICNTGSEFDILVKMSEAELFSHLPEKVAEGVKRVRQKQLKLIPGYDGEYGIIKLFEEEPKQSQQFTLF